MKVDDIHHILVIGAGTMGHQIAFQCAISGYDVSVYDMFPEMLKKAEERIAFLSRTLMHKGHISPAQAENALKRIVFTSDAQKAGQNADLISESIPEDPKLKGEIFARFHKICPKETIFTTNTSSLLPSLFAQATGRPEQFLAFHFHDIAISRIADVMPHPGTDPEVVGIVAEFAEKIGQIPIVLKKEYPGYLFNNMFMALLDSALTLASKNIGAIEDIDRCWMGIMHTASGPFGIMDSVGLDTVWKITSYHAQKRGDANAMKNAEFIKSYVDAGRMGKKAGQGFYKYPNPAFLCPGFLEGKTASSAQEK